MIAKVPLSWIKSFRSGFVIPHILRKCSKCTKDILCDGCDKIENQRKELFANLNELQRQPPIEFGNMLPKYITI